MKNFRVKENGISLIALVITIIVLIILTNVLVYNSLDRIYIKKITNLNNDIELLREKTSDFYEQYGKIPAEIKYPKDNLTELKDVLSIKNDIGDFYVIDLEAMQGITLNYGKDYDTIKNDKDNVAKYTDVYIINENSHNIFYVKGISIEENNVEKKYYTDYTKPDETTVDLRYIDEKLIPENYYYIGEYKDNSGNESIVISNIKDEEVDTTKSNQYVWTKQISKLESLPASITLNEEQTEEEFLISVNNNKGYFKNKDGKVIYTKIDEEKWSEIYTKEAKYTDINGDTITIPKGFQVSMSKSMNIVKNGLVIRDKNQNEWVWVEVPSKVFKTATNETEYEKIETDLKEYVKEYRLNSEKSEISADWKDEWYDGCGLTKEEYTKTYQTMLSSVYKNKGFWVSRYEIGDETATTNSYSMRTSTSGITGNPVSKRNMIPYNYITCSQAQSLTSKITADTDKTKSLLFGIQWDLICKFIEDNSDLKYTDIANDSSSWANTYNSSFTIKKGRYLTSQAGWLSATENNYTKAEKTAAIITTGAIEKSRALNIYDFAGNMIEWTLEKYKDEMVTTGRGGSYSDLEDYGKASSRINSSIKEGLENSRINFGFRIAMY